MEIIINKDIRKVKTKDLGMFSFKEAGFLALAVGLGAGIFFLEKKVLGFEKINYYLMIIPMAIPLIFGFFKPFGLTFWQFCKTYIQETFVKPSVYTLSYQSENEIELNYEDLVKVYGIEYFTGDDLLSDFKIDRTSPEFKNELKKANKLGI